MGNSVTFAALDELSPAPCALVSISPVLVASDSHGTVDGRGDLPYPREVWIAWEEQNPSIVANVQLIRARAATGICRRHTCTALTPTTTASSWSTTARTCVPSSCRPSTRAAVDPVSRRGR